MRSAGKQNVVKPIPKKSMWPIAKDKDDPVNQSKREATT